MPSNLTIYNLGSKGVDVDKNPLELEDGELTKAQNASQDPLGGSGGLRKRQGLTVFNGVAGAGSFLGGIGVPLPFPGSSNIAVRKLYLGYQSGASSGTSLGYQTSTNGFVSSTQVTTVPPAFPRSNAKIAYNIAADDTKVVCGRSGCLFDNRIYYAADGYVQYPTASYVSPPIRVFDGTVDKELCRIPYNPDAGATTKCLGIVSMIAANNLIYLSTYDKGTDDSTLLGRVFSLDPNSGQLIQLGATFTTGHLPLTLCWALGRLWVGSFRASVANRGNIYFFRPGIDTTWTLDRTVGVNYTTVAALCSFQGLLYASELGNATTAGIITQRAADGTWSTVETGPSATAASNGYKSMVVFNNVLYAAYFSLTAYAGNHTTIRKYNGTTWSDARAADPTPAGVGFKILRVFNNVLYAITGDFTSETNGLLYTTNGTTWTAGTITSGNYTFSNIFEEITS